VLLVTHESALAHPTPAGHPERADRIPAAVAGVVASGTAVVRREAPPASLGELARIHRQDYIADIEAFCGAGRGALDPDTYAGPESWEAALRAAGAGYAAVDGLRSGDAATAFVAMRPPGHHAEAGRAMGFCLFNNIAVTAARLVAEGERVAIVDWDVHHGNGTQRSFFTESRVLYVSLHESPFYPGTGHVHEVGTGEGRGTVVNVPVPAGTGGATYGDAFRRLVVPIASQFAPTWVLVSAGYDAHRADPLAGVRLEAGDFAGMADSLAAVVPARRVVFFLEGGYDLGAITESVAATIRGALGSSDIGDWPDGPEDPAVTTAVMAHTGFWRL